VEHRHRLGIFARSWPEWVTVETAIKMDIDWICLKEPTFFDVLNVLYPHSKVVLWEEGVVLPQVTVMMCSQWIPSKSHAIWKTLELKLVLAQVTSPRFKTQSLPAAN
jgi:hypothetical protein